MRYVVFSLNYYRSVFLANNSMHIRRDLTWMARTDFASQLTLHGHQDLGTNWEAIPHDKPQVPDMHSALIRCQMSQSGGPFVTMCVLSLFHRKVRERLSKEIWSYTWLSSPSPTNTRPILCLWIVAHSHRCVTCGLVKEIIQCVFRKHLYLFITGHQRN